MTSVFQISTFWTVALILLGLLLVGLMRGLRRLIEALPISQARRETLRRYLPLGEIIVGLLYVLVSVPVILDHDPTTTPIVTASRRNSQTMSLSGVSSKTRPWVDSVISVLPLGSR